MLTRLILFLLVAAFAIVVGFFTFPPSQAVVVVRRLGYWVMLAEFALFVFYAWRSLRDRAWAGWFGREWRWMTLVLLGAASLHVHEPHGIKIMSDEAILNCTAMQMHFDRDSAVLLRAYNVDGNFTPTLVVLDKRPLFFPFLVSLVHDLTGFRLENSVALNALLSVALMGLVFLVGRKLVGNAGGALAVLMMASVPLVAQNATAAGFELLNLVMILLTLWFGMRLLEQPTDDRLSAFLLSGVLLMQVRYESVLFILPVAGMIVFLWFRRRAIWLPPVLIASPLMLVLFPLQYSVFKLSDYTWQLSGVPGATSPFGLQYFYDNVGHAAAFFFTFDGTQPSSALVAAVGILGVGFCLLRFYKEHRSISQKGGVDAAWMIFFFGLLIHTALMMLYFWGHWDDPIIRRLSLPCHILLILSFVSIYPRLLTWRWKWHAAAIAFGAYILAFTIPWSAMHRYTNENFAARAAMWVHDFAKGQRERRVLALDVNTGFIWFLNRQATLTAGAVASRPEQFLYHYKIGTFDEVLVVQRITADIKTGERWIVIEDDIGDAMKTELVTERQFGMGYWVRISRVTQVDESNLRAWAVEKVRTLSLPSEQQPGTVVRRQTAPWSEWVEQLP